MIDCKIILENVRMCKHSTGDVVQRNRVDVRHIVELSEIVCSTPFCPAVQIGLCQVKVVLRIVQYLKIKIDIQLLRV